MQQAVINLEPKFHLKTNRIYTRWRRHAWLLVPIIAFGSLYYPPLGLGVALIMLVIMISGVFQGRYFCGNVCPHGSLFDRLSLPASLNARIPRLFSSSALKWGFFGFYMLMFAVRLGRVMPFWGDPEFLGRFGALMGRQYLTMPTIVGASLAFLNPRTWCSFCPMGTTGQLMYKLGKALGVNRKTDRKVTIAAPEKCHTCATCARVCPMQLEPYKNFDLNNQFSNEACIRCGTCGANCPADLLSLATEKQARELRRGTSLEGYEQRRPVTAKLEKITALRENVRELTFTTNGSSGSTPGNGSAATVVRPAAAVDGAVPAADGNNAAGSDPAGNNAAGRDRAAIEYKPGQFVLVKVSDEPEVFRAYSISSTDPADPHSISVTVMHKPGGFGSKAVFGQFEEGQELQLEGPMGNELVVDKNAAKVLLIAGGIGVTPFVPIAKDLVENPGAIEQATLLYGVNKPDEFLYDEHFRELAERSEAFSYVRTVAFPDEDWEGHTGFVTAVLEEMDLSDHKIYMCGPPPMVSAVTKTLHRMHAEGRGVSEEYVHYETAS